MNIPTEVLGCRVLQIAPHPRGGGWAVICRRDTWIVCNVSYEFDVTEGISVASFAEAQTVWNERMGLMTWEEHGELMESDLQMASEYIE